VSTNHLPSVPQALKDALENIIEETLFSHESVEDWADSVRTKYDNWGTDGEGNAVFGIKSDSTVQDILALVVRALEEIFIECEPYGIGLE